MDTKFCMARANERVRCTRATKNLCNTTRWLLTSFFFFANRPPRPFRQPDHVRLHRQDMCRATARTNILHQRLVNKTQQTSSQSCNRTSWFEPSRRKPADCLPPSTAKSITLILFRLSIFDLLTLPTTSMLLVSWPPVSRTQRACPGRPSHLLSISTLCTGAWRNRVANHLEQPLALPEMTCTRCPESSAWRPCKACSCDHRPSAEHLRELGPR